MNRRIALAVLLASGVGLAQWNAAALGGFGVATSADAQLIPTCCKPKATGDDTLSSE